MEGQAQMQQAAAAVAAAAAEALASKGCSAAPPAPIVELIVAKG